MERVVGPGARMVMKKFFGRGTDKGDANSYNENNQSLAGESENSGPSLKRKFSSYNALKFPAFFSKRRRRQESPAALSNSASPARNSDVAETGQCQQQQLVIESDDENESQKASDQTKAVISGPGMTFISGSHRISTTPVETNAIHGRIRRGKRRRSSPPLKSTIMSAAATTEAAVVNTKDSVFDFLGDGMSPIGGHAYQKRVTSPPPKSPQDTTLASNTTATSHVKMKSTSNRKGSNTSKKESGLALEDDNKFTFMAGKKNTNQSRRTPQVRISNTSHNMISHRKIVNRAPDKSQASPTVARDAKNTGSAPSRRRKKSGVRKTESNLDTGNLTDSPNESNSLGKQSPAALSATGSSPDDELLENNGEDGVEAKGESHPLERNVKNGTCGGEPDHTTKRNEYSSCPGPDVEANIVGSNRPSKGTSEPPTEADDSVDDVEARSIWNLPASLAPHNNPGLQDYAIVLNSRLRSRQRENQDVAYIHISGQKRCKGLMDDDSKINGVDRGSGKMCNNCAVGTSDYCNTHRELDQNLKDYYEKRHGKFQAKAESSRSAALNKMNNGVDTASANGRIFMAPDERGHMLNDAMRCVFALGQNDRCTETVSEGKVCCSEHSKQEALSRKEKGNEFIEDHTGARRCIAIERTGKVCIYRSADKVVFCPLHMCSRPSKVSHLPSISTKDRRPLFRSVSGTHQCRTIRFDGARCLFQAVGKTGHCSRHLSDKLNSGMASGKRTNSSNASDRSAPTSIVEVASLSHDAEVNTAQSSSIEDTISGGIKSENELRATREMTFRERALQQRPLSRNCLPLLDSSTQDIRKLLDDRCVFVRDRKRCESRCISGNIFCAAHGAEGSFSSSADVCGTVENDSESPAGTEAESGDTPLDGKLQDRSSDTSSDSSDYDNSYGDSDTDGDDVSNPQEQTRSRTYKHSEFLSMWHKCEELCGEGTDEIESTKRVRAANQKMNPDDTDGQLKAQYGRLLPLGMKRIMEILEMTKNDVFLDIGHGIGNTCLHAAFCVGCDARGIEVVSGRHSIAEVFRDQLISQNRGSTPPRAIGSIDLRLGRLEDPTHTDFLTKGVTRAYVNNFSGVFAERSSKNDQKWFLDDYVAGLFAQLEPGSIMITFHPINLGLDRDAANDQRKKHNLSESDNSSFFLFEKLTLGKACKTVKWNIRSGNQNEIEVYKYKRLSQPGKGKAVFLCTNPQCQKALDAVPIEATMENEEGRCVIAHCSCKFSPKNLRRQSKKVYAE